MKWILGLVCLFVLGYGLSEAGFFRHRASANACAVPAAAACTGAAPAAAPAACAGVQAAPAAGCAGVQRQRTRIVFKARAGC